MESDDGSVRVRQRRDALAHANRLRVARAGLKRRIAAGEVSAAEVILRSSWELESMPIANLLMSQRGWGQQRCRGFLIAIGIRENKPIGSMTERQRSALAAELVGATRASATASAGRRRQMDAEGDSLGRSRDGGRALKRGHGWP